MMPEGGNRMEDEVPVVHWRKICIAVAVVTLMWAAYAAVQATRRAGEYDAGGSPATAEQFVEEHLRIERMEQGVLHFHGAQGERAAEKVFVLPTT